MRAEELNDPGTLMEALFMPGLTLIMRADFAGARACHVRALANYDDRARTKFWASRTGQDSGVTHRCFLAIELWHLGYPDQALQVNREMRDIARAIGHPFSLAYALGMTGWLYQDCRLGAEAEAAGDEELGMEQSFDYWHTSGLLFKAGGILLQGRVDDAVALLPLMREEVYRGVWACALTCYFSIAGEAYTRANRFADARRILDEGLAVAEERDERFLEAELYRLFGELHLAEADDQAAAEGFFRNAIETLAASRARHGSCAP